MLGGILGGTLAVLAAIRYMRFDGRAVDAFAAANPVGLAAGKIGCFLVGCCFGQPTDLIWGTTYPPGTAPFAAQVGSGLITADATSSLHVHPVQLYEAALVLVLAALVMCFGKRLRRPGSAFLLVCAGYAALRFGTEFFRFKQTALAGLTATQWALGAAALLLGTALILREREHGSASDGVEQDSYAVAQCRSGHVMVLLAAAVIPMAAWLSPLETVVGLGVTLAPLVVVMNRFLALRAATAPALAIAVIGVSVQQNDSTGPRTYVTLGGGAMAGRYQESCGPLHNYNAGGVSLAVTRELAENRSATVRAQVFAGRDETIEANPRSMDMTGFGLNARFDWTHFGIGVGGLAGDLIFDGGIERVLPSASLRIVSQRRLFLEARVFDHEPAPVPAQAKLLRVLENRSCPWALDTGWMTAAPTFEPASVDPDSTAPVDSSLEPRTNTMSACFSARASAAARARLRAASYRRDATLANPGLRNQRDLAQICDCTGSPRLLSSAQRSRRARTALQCGRSVYDVSQMGCARVVGSDSSRQPVIPRRSSVNVG